MRTYLRTVLWILAVMELVLGLVAYLAYAGPHLVFHLGHLEVDERTLSVGLAVILALMVALPLSAPAGTRKLT